MKSIFTKTFGGLTNEYLFRQLFFGTAIGALILWGQHSSHLGIGIAEVLAIATLTILYPYSRFVYESVVGFIMGDNVFFVNAIISLVWTFGTMLLCYLFACFIAPIGLAYLYYHNSKAAQ